MLILKHTSVISLRNQAACNRHARLQEVLARVQETVATVLGRPVAPDEPLMAAGLDSLGAVELRNALEASLAVQLPSTLTFDHPTPAAVAAFVAARVRPAVSAVPASEAGSDAFYDLHEADDGFSEDEGAWEEEAGEGAEAEGLSAPALRARVAEAVSAIVGRTVADGEPLMAAGLDSLGAVELRNALEGKLGCSLPSTLIFDHPSVEVGKYKEIVFVCDDARTGARRQLHLHNLLSCRFQTIIVAVVQIMRMFVVFLQAITSFVDDLLAAEQPEAAAAVAPAASALALVPPRSAPAFTGPTAAGDFRCVVIAVVATASRTPHSVLASSNAASDVISSVPWQRWDVETQLTDDAPARFGGFLADVQRFDAAAFGLSEKEAAMMDPQQRLLLEVGFELLSGGGGAGRGRDDAAGRRTGCYVGISTPDYSDLKKAHAPIGVYSATGSALSVASGRLSFIFGLKGPSVSVDTACSSSLVGAHSAARALAAGDCTAALVLGVKVILTPSLSAMFTKAGGSIRIVLICLLSLNRVQQGSTVVPVALALHVCAVAHTQLIF